MEFLKILINVDSSSGNEAGVADIISAWLKARSWTIEQQFVSGPNYNVFAHLGVATPRLIITTHLDTAPGFYNATEDELNVYGRGASDPKGVIISQLFAVQQLIDERHLANSDVGLLFVTSGETGGQGMIMAGDLNLAPQFVLAGEPTQLKLATGFVNSSTFRLISSTRKTFCFISPKIPGHANIPCGKVWNGSALWISLIRWICAPPAHDLPSGSVSPSVA